MCINSYYMGLRCVACLLTFASTREIIIKLNSQIQHSYFVLMVLSCVKIGVVVNLYEIRNSYGANHQSNDRYPLEFAYI